MSVKYETIQAALRDYRRKLHLLGNHNGASAIKERKFLEQEICGLEEMADKIESRARDIQIEMGV